MGNGILSSLSVLELETYTYVNRNINAPKCMLLLQSISLHFKAQGGAPRNLNANVGLNNISCIGETWERVDHQVPRFVHTLVYLCNNCEL